MLRVRKGFLGFLWFRNNMCGIQVDFSRLGTVTVSDAENGPRLDDSKTVCDHSSVNSDNHDNGGSPKPWAMP